MTFSQCSSNNFYFLLVIVFTISSIPIIFLEILLQSLAGLCFDMDFVFFPPSLHHIILSLSKPRFPHCHFLVFLLNIFLLHIELPCPSAVLPPFHFAILLLSASALDCLCQPPPLFRVPVPVLVSRWTPMSGTVLPSFFPRHQVTIPRLCPLALMSERKQFSSQSSAVFVSLCNFHCSTRAFLPWSQFDAVHF